jgi:hypothetical protein
MYGAPQSSIAGGDAIVTLGLKEGQEVTDLLGGEIGDVEILDSLCCLRRSKTQKQNDGIPVVAYGVSAGTPERRQILAEEPLDALAEFVRSSGSHAAPPVMRWPKCVSSRSLAAAASCGIQRR